MRLAEGRWREDAHTQQSLRFRVCGEQQTMDGSGWCTLKTGAETDASFFLSSGCVVGRGVLEEWPKVPDCSSAGGDDQDEAEARSVGQ